MQKKICWNVEWKDASWSVLVNTMEAFVQTQEIRYASRKPRAIYEFWKKQRTRVVFVSIEHDKRVKSEERLGRSEKSPMGIRPFRECYRFTPSATRDAWSWLPSSHVVIYRVLKIDSPCPSLFLSYPFSSTRWLTSESRFSRRNFFLVRFNRV